MSFLLSQYPSFCWLLTQDSVEVLLVFLTEYTKLAGQKDTHRHKVGLHPGFGNGFLEKITNLHLGAEVTKVPGFLEWGQCAWGRSPTSKALLHSCRSLEWPFFSVGILTTESLGFGSS